MERQGRIGVLLCVALALVAAPPSVAVAGDDTFVSTPLGFVPVALWEIRREGYPAVRHAWAAGTDTMLRVSWDDGVTWYGFRPMFTDSVRGMLALKVASRDELGRGEIGWKDKAGITLVTGRVGRVTIPAGSGNPSLDIALELLNVKDVSPLELKAPSSDAEVVDLGGVALNSSGGGPESCCVTCQGVRACNCSVCIPECHQSCCAGGCFCQSC